MMVGGDSWPRYLLVGQAFMGAATVALTIAIARQWMPMWAALATGLLLTFWPHHIAFTAEVLGEVELGLCLTGALLLTVIAVERKSAGLGVAAGATWAAAYLVNPIVALLPVAIGVIYWRPGTRQTAVAALIPLVIVAGLWSMRGVHGGSDRIWINLVQGSYPLYHRAYVSRNAHPEPARIIAEIDAETQLMVRDKGAGGKAMAARLTSDPGAYARWYGSKAYLLWAWDVRISDAFGPYVHVVNGSPLEQFPLSLAMTFTRMLNPFIFVVALLFAVYALARGPAAARILALSFLYFTAVHLILQAEPRYSTPYRPIELLLFVGGIAAVALSFKSSGTRQAEQ
jgi:multisubunit Na+/H+ antiporter MnhF subunit